MKVFVPPVHEALGEAHDAVRRLIVALGHGYVDKVAAADTCVLLATSQRELPAGMPTLSFQQAGTEPTGAVEYTSIHDLLIKVAAALRAAGNRPDRLEWATLPYRVKPSALSMYQVNPSRARLVLHAVPVESDRPRLTAAQLRAVPDRMVQTIRHHGLAGVDDPFETVEGHDCITVRCPDRETAGGLGGVRRRHDGQVALWHWLPRGPMLTSFIDETRAADVLCRFLRAAAEIGVPGRLVVPVAVLTPTAGVAIGDPAVTPDSARTPRLRRASGGISTATDEVVFTHALVASAPEIATELATQLLRSMRRLMERR